MRPRITLALFVVATLGFSVLLSCSSDAPSAPRVMRLFLNGYKECMMTSIGLLPELNRDEQTVQVLWTVPIEAKWGGSPGFSGVWNTDGSTSDEWWHYDGDWYCEDEGGGGGVLFPNINPNPDCLPREDPRCAFDSLSVAEKNTVTAALSGWVRTSSEMPDSATQIFCQTLVGYVQDALENDLIVVTANDSVPPDTSIGHYSAYDVLTGIAHVEPWLLADAQDPQNAQHEKAQWELAAAVMH
jgi:hypothetical protein